VRVPAVSQIIARTPVPYVGDELHHSGWNACSSCHGDAAYKRNLLVLPGFASGRIYGVRSVHSDHPFSLAACGLTRRWVWF